jgi:hypothetical protein
MVKRSSFAATGLMEEDTTRMSLLRIGSNRFEIRDLRLSQGCHFSYLISTDRNSCKLEM